MSPRTSCIKLSFPHTITTQRACAEQPNCTLRQHPVLHQLHQYRDLRMSKSPEKQRFAGLLLWKPLSAERSENEIIPIFTLHGKFMLGCTFSKQSLVSNTWIFSTDESDELRERRHGHQTLNRDLTVTEYAYLIKSYPHSDSLLSTAQYAEISNHKFEHDFSIRIQ